MKKIFSAILVITLMMSFFALNVEADLVNRVTVNAESREIIIRGNIPDYKNSDIISIFLLFPGKTMEDAGAMLSGDDVVAHVGMTYLNTDGFYEYKFVCRKPSGDYLLYLKCTDIIFQTDINPAVSESKVFNLIYGMPESFPPVTGNSVYDRFQKYKDELPDEVPVVSPKTVKGDNKIFVSPNGNDVNDGAINTPVKTPKRALDLAAQIKDKNGGTVIYFRKGEYFIEDCINLTQAHSGTEGAPLFLSAYNDEEVRFTQGTAIEWSSLKQISDLSVLQRLPIDSLDKVFEIDLDELGIDADGLYTSVTDTPTLIYGTEAMSMARWPNDTSIEVESVIDSGYDGVESSEYYDASKDRGFEVTFDEERPFSWENTGEIWMYGSFWKEWVKRNYLVENFNRALHSVKSAFVVTDNGGRMCPATNNDTFGYFFNVLEEMDLPGEWVLDKVNKKIYLYPLDNDENGRFFLLRGDEKLRIISQQRSSIGDVIFLNKTENCVINGITFAISPCNQVRITDGIGNIVQNCTFANAYQGVVLGGIDSKYNGIINCKFIQLNYNGVNIAAKIEQQKVLSPQRNYVQNCYFYEMEDAIRLENIGSIISHNLIAHAWGRGISMGSGVAECIIEYNEISSSPYFSKDAAAIYISGGKLYNRSNHIRYNYIHNLRESSGIYFDDLTNAQFAYGNVISGGVKPLFIHSGSENVFVNNIVMDNEIYSGNVNESSTWFEASRNARWLNSMLGLTEVYEGADEYYYLFSQERLARYPTDYQYFIKLREDSNAWKNGTGIYGSEIDRELRIPKNNVIKNNVLWNIGLILGKVRESDPGEVENNYQVSIDPGFENADANNYNLSANSEVFNQIPDFHPIPFDKMGTTESEVVEIGSQIKAIFPANGETVSPENFSLKYSAVLGADDYTVTVAEDADFHNVVHTVTTPNTTCAIELDFGNKEYFWQVTANINLKSAAQVNVQSPICSFVTKSMSITRTEFKIENAGTQLNSAKVYLKGYYGGCEMVNLLVGLYAEDELVNFYMDGDVLLNQVSEESVLVPNVECGTTLDSVRIFAWSTDNMITPLHKSVRFNVTRAGSSATE